MANLPSRTELYADVSLQVFSCEMYPIEDSTISNKRRGMWHGDETSHREPVSPSSAGNTFNVNSIWYVARMVNRKSFVFYCVIRVYSQALLVLDDDDFYELQTVFNLGQQRAIATSLNTLVFSTHCPAKAAKKLTDAALPYPGGGSMVDVSAPI